MDEEALLMLDLWERAARLVLGTAAGAALMGTLLARLMAAS